MITRSPISQQQERWRSVRAQQKQREDIRDIGAPPKIVDEKRREACSQSLREYLLTYHSGTFNMPFSPDHEQLISMTEESLLHGGAVVCAMPRGSGKTSVFQKAMEWAVLNNKRQFGMLICADEKKFKGLLNGIKTSFESNPLLLEDYPEVVHPVLSLDRSATRSLYQLCDGAPTFINWGALQIVFPTTKWTIERGNAGNAIGGGGLSGAAIRGTVLSLPDGSQRRVDAVLADDPQTRKSAKSESQCQEREDILKGDVMGMAGPGRNISCVVACTVIYRDDLAERLLDQDRSPQWKRVRVSMVKKWPTNMNLWEQYHEIRRREMLGEEDRGAANAFYAQQRDVMDDGCQVYWNERIAPGFTSAIESAMAEYFEDPRAFLAEKQNTPEEMVDNDFVPLVSLQLVQRQSHCKKNLVPNNVEYITAHVDVQEKLLYWMVVGWTKRFGGYILDYGHTPKQHRSMFTLLSIKRTRLQDKFPDDDTDGSIRQGVAATLSMLAQYQWTREDGTKMSLDRGLIDTRYKSDIVEEGISASGYQAVWMPAWGVGVGAKDTPLKLRSAFRGKTGQHWVYQKPKDRLFRGIFVDTNYWKDEVYNGLFVPKAHSHAILLFKTLTGSSHQMVADHFCAERATRVEANGRKINEWDNWKRHDNHHFDNLVGCMVGASTLGVQKESKQSVGDDEPYQRRKRKVVWKR